MLGAGDMADIGGGRFGIDGFEGAEVWVVGLAD